MLASDNYCSSQPCYNGGTCFNLYFDWTCKCPQGKYSGKDCRTLNYNPCLKYNPCQNNGICGLTSDLSKIKIKELILLKLKTISI